MLKIVKSFSKGKLRRNILFITKCDQLFAEAAGHPPDMFYHIYDSIRSFCKKGTFYNVYFIDIPIAYIFIDQPTKQVAFYLDVSYRTRATITELFNFIRSKVGSEFYTGTKKINQRFIDFANKNGWVVWLEDENNVIYKATI